MMLFYRRLCNIKFLLSIFITISLYQQYLPAEIESSSFSISLRKNISNSWLDYAINEEMKDLHSPCCTVGVYANISTSQEVQCCPNLADEFSVKKMHRSAHIIYENDSKLTAHHSAAIDNRVTIGMTTCKRLPLFLRAMSRLIAHIGHFPNSIIREVDYFVCMLSFIHINPNCLFKVVVIDDNSSPQDRKIMLDTFPMVRYIMKV